MAGNNYRGTLLAGLATAMVLHVILLAGVFFFASRDHMAPTRASAAQPAGATLPAPVDADTVADVVARCSPAVVKIETTQQLSPNIDPFFRQFFGAPGQGPTGQRIQQGLGSGFIVGKEGYILTNEHVISGADAIRVYLAEREEPLQARLVGADAELDLAVLKVEAGKDLPFLEFGDSNQAQAGQWVIAIGNPYGLDHTVTTGVISAKGRPLEIEGRSYKDLLQTDASINPGNSGGPLLDLRGSVIGINTAINTEARGIGFAIPANTVREVLDTLIAAGKISRPFMGVYLQNNSPELAAKLGLTSPTGAVVAGVVPGSPAEKAGLREGDLITGIGTEKVEDAGDITGFIEQSSVGDKVPLQVENRAGKKTVSVTLGER